MRPARLELEGFTSFRQNVALDFSPLDLFVITGPTGAGKTSLIDAIIYALFGRTPRIGDKDASDLISQGIERMRVLLEFRAGKKNYRVLRTLKRGSSQKLQLEVQDSAGEWEALSNRVFEVRAKIEEILGIDFDGFTKSIVLPQGEFDRFLRGDPVERRRILSDLLHLGIYEEMGKRARQIEQNTRLEQSVIEQHIASTFADVNQERKTMLETKLNELTTRQSQLSEQLKVIHKAQPLAIELSNHRATQGQATKENAAANESLKRARASSVSAKDTAARHKKRLDKLEELILACGYNSERHLELKSLLPLAQEQEQCHKTIADFQAEHKRLNAETKQVQSAATKTKLKWEQLAKELKLKDQAAQNAKKQVDAAKKQFGSSDAILQVVEDLQAAEEQLQEKAELLQNIADTDQKLHEVEKEIAELKRQYEQADTGFKEAKAALEELQQQHAAKEIRRQLKKGAPCPVCDQMVSVLPASGKHPPLQHAKELFEQREKVKDKYNTLLLKKQNLSESLPIQLKTLKKSLKSVEASIAAATTKAERLLGKPPGKNAAEQLQKIAEELSVLEAAYESAGTEFREIQEAEADAKEAHSNDQHEIKLIFQQVETLEKALAEKNERFAILGKQLTGQPDVRVLAEEVKQMEKAKKEQQAYENEKRQEQTLHLSAEKQHVIAEAEVSGFQQRITQLQSSINAATASIGGLEQKIREYISVPKGADEITYLDQCRSSLERESRELTGNIVTAQKDLDFVVKSLADLADKRQQLNALKAKAELYRELGVALKADQFIRFVVEEALARLADHGTQHLTRLSSGRFSFATQTDDFLVVDHWNADEPRSVNTLSGGESFLASLSLALALGDALVELSPEVGRFNLDSLFLDEGFSTLDPETLDVVVQAIETLAGGQRLVGIVSHIPELAERFTAQVEVQKAVGGSGIVIKGENRNIQKYAMAQ